jgi:hypothetical protein
MPRNFIYNISCRHKSRPASIPDMRSRTAALVLTWIERRAGLSRRQCYSANTVLAMVPASGPDAGKNSAAGLLG